MPYKTRAAAPLAIRFGALFSPEPNTGCWLWAGGSNPKGYGVINSGRRGPSIGAHRASWIIHRGPVPPGMMVCHRCDTPPCVNPAHLFLGTAAENTADMIRKGRLSMHPRPRGDNHYRRRLARKAG